MFGLTAQSLGCRATRVGIGNLAHLTGRCRERIQRELEKEPERAYKVARDKTRLTGAGREERARGLRIED